jgi:competence protein ComEA
MVANRDAQGPFGTLAALDRVPGIGPGLLQALAPHLMFGRAKELQTSSVASSAGVGTPFASRPATGMTAAVLGLRDTVLNVNRATAVELEGLPGIGPALARRIVADREAQGPFATVAALERVPGIGPALVARLGRFVTAP